MKSAQLTGIRQIRLQEVPDPVLREENDVLIRMAAIGVCGSDVHYYANGKIGSQVVNYPFTAGHEGAGVVEAVGAGVDRVKPGDRITVEPAMSCHECDQCLAGRPHTCRSLRFLGCPKQAEGCLSEYMVMPEECCFPIPESLSLEEAALVEPLAIGVYAVQQSDPVAGKRIAILGSGPIGLSVLIAARTEGAEAVFMTDKIEARQKKAAELGADWSGNENQTEAMLAAEPSGFDVVFECCGDQAAIDQAVELIKPGGILMVVGIPQFERWSFAVDTARHKELTLRNVRRQNGCVESAIELLARGQSGAEAMITHRFGFAETAEAFELVDGYRDGVVKAMIQL